ncbi:energy transducer TonB [Anaerosinus sp.]|uniref:energy transducer TonB n=1 Tax=Selenobaculum sp. TaxID=3074374 RepID=UPI003AB1B91A
MHKQSKEERLSLGISLFLHIIVFVLVASTGLFMRMDSSTAKVVDVTVYEDVGGGDAGGDDGAAMAEAIEPAVEDIVLKNDANIPPVTQQYTEERKQPIEKNIPNQAITNHGNNTSGSAVGNGQGSNGEGSGNGQGEGAGSDSGTGSGNGSGDGDALKPKTPPKLIADAAPNYPKKLQRQGIEGAVKVKVLVGTDGSAENVEVVSSSGYDAFDSEAVKAAYRLSFSPAKNVYGDAVRCHIYRTFSFTIT